MKFASTKLILQALFLGSLLEAVNAQVAPTTTSPSAVLPSDQTGGPSTSTLTDAPATSAPSALLSSSPLTLVPSPVPLTTSTTSPSELLPSSVPTSIPVLVEAQTPPPSFSSVPSSSAFTTPPTAPTITNSSDAGPVENSSPAPSVSIQPSFAPTTAGGPTSMLQAQCSAYNACSMLVDDCCPTMDGQYLYCCFQSENPESYSTDFALVKDTKNIGRDSFSEEAEYFMSTSIDYENATAPNGDVPVISYARNETAVYDMIYYNTNELISNVSEYVMGRSKFYMDLWSEAPICTQVMVQLDSLVDAMPDNYPIGRNSRYIATTTKQGEWERLEFDFLDQPDGGGDGGGGGGGGGNLTDDSVDAMVIFFAPGKPSAGQFYFRNLDSASAGCLSDELCEVPVPKSCSAFLEGETCDDGIDNDNDGLIDCEDPECSDSVECGDSVRVAYSSVKSQLRAAESGGGSSGSSSTIWNKNGVSARGLLSALVAFVAALML